MVFRTPFPGSFREGPILVFPESSRIFVFRRQKKVFESAPSSLSLSPLNSHYTRAWRQLTDVMMLIGGMWNVYKSVLLGKRIYSSLLFALVRKEA